jgi:hypothetical protein
MRLIGRTAWGFVWLAVMGLAGGAPTRVLAQTATTGAITGTIEDPRGQVVPGAAVKATNLLTNDTRTAQSGPSGDFIIPLLPVSQYKVDVTASGFAPWTRLPISVQVTEQVTVNATLKIGTATEAVTVTGKSEMIQPTSSELGGVVDPGTIVDLPLATRNYTQLMILSPGISASVPNAAGFGLNSIELSSNGARAADNSLEINGADSMNVFTNTIASYVGTQGVAVPAADSLEEFKVQTAQYSATTGRNAGANIAVVTKSGTNEFHGDIYEYFRNDALNANGFFQNELGQKRSTLRQNQYGFTLGGPIQKDKMFFFGSYQGTKQINGIASSSTVILPPLTSDRSAAALGNTFCGQKAFSAIVPGGVGPAVACDGSNINPVALAYLNGKLPNGQFIIPSPQSASGLSIFQEPDRFSEEQFNANLDREFGAKSTLSAKYFYSNQQSLLAFDGANVPGFSGTVPGRNHNFSLAYTSSLSPHLINVGRFGYTRLASTTTIEDPVTAADVGMTTAPAVKALPLTEVEGEFAVGVPTNANQGSATNNFILADSVSYVRGRHLMQFGVEVKAIRSLAYDHAEQYAEMVFLDFPSFLLGLNAAQNGFPYSDVLATLTYSGNFSRDYRVRDIGSFFQDDIRVTHRLSLNLGLRWDYFGLTVDAAGLNSNFDFSRALAVPPPQGTNSGYVVGKDTPGGALPSDVFRANSNSLVQSNPRNFEPRLGFAYQPGGGLKNLVVRGGYGIYYSRSAQIGIFQNVVAFPFAEENLIELQPGSTATFQNPFPPALPSSAFPLFVPRTVSSQQSLTTQDPNLRNPYEQQYSLGVQYEFASNYLLEVGYVGTKATHLIGSVGVNQPLLASVTSPVHGITTNTVENASMRVPFQGLAPTTAVSEFLDGFGSNYNSLQVSVTKRFSHGFQFTSAYTYSKLLDDLSTNSGVFLSTGGLSGDQDNFSQAYGPGDFDRKNRLVVSGIWQLPKTTRGPSIARAVVNDWKMAGLLTLQSGLPLTITDATAATIYAGNSRAQFAPGMSNKDAVLSGSVEDRLNEYFNTSAFTSAPPIGDGTGFGNSGRGILRGPDERNLDFAVVRQFHLRHLGEQGIVQFRAEAFNLTNTPNFNGPGTERSTPSSFGVITSTSINPRIVQFALKVNF